MKYIYFLKCYYRCYDYQAHALIERNSYKALQSRVKWLRNETFPSTQPILHVNPVNYRPDWSSLSNFILLHFLSIISWLIEKIEEDASAGIGKFPP